MQRVHLVLLGVLLLVLVVPGVTGHLLFGRLPVVDVPLQLGLPGRLSDLLAPVVHAVPLLPLLGL